MMNTAHQRVRAEQTLVMMQETSSRPQKEQTHEAVRVGSDIRTHAPARAISGPAVTYPFIMTNCFTNTLGHGLGYAGHNQMSISSCNK